MPAAGKPAGRRSYLSLEFLPQGTKFSNPPSAVMFYIGC